MWDNIVDAVADDQDFMQETIEESKKVDDLDKAGSRPKKHHHKDNLLLKFDEETVDEPNPTISYKAAELTNDGLLRGLSAENEDAEDPTGQLKLAQAEDESEDAIKYSAAHHGNPDWEYACNVDQFKQFFET